MHVSKNFFEVECLANVPAQLLYKWRYLFSLSLGVLFGDGSLLVQVVLFFMLHILPYTVGLVVEITPLVSLGCASDLLVGVPAYELIRRRNYRLTVAGRLRRRYLLREEVGSAVCIVYRGVVGRKVGKGVGCVVGERVSVWWQRVVEAEGRVLDGLWVWICRVLGTAVGRTLAGTCLGLHLVVCMAETSRRCERVDAAWSPSRRLVRESGSVATNIGGECGKLVKFEWNSYSLSGPVGIVVRRVVLSSGQIRPQTRAECEDAMSLLSGLASSVSLCARRELYVSYALRVVDTDADVRDSVQSTWLS